MKLPGSRPVDNGLGEIEECISTGDLNALLPFVMNAQEMMSWGLKPHTKFKNGCWWRVADVPQIWGVVMARANKSLGESLGLNGPMPTLDQLVPPVLVEVSRDESVGLAPMATTATRATPEEIAEAVKLFAGAECKVKPDAETETEGGKLWIQVWALLYEV